MKLSTLVKENNLEHFAKRACSDGVAQYIGLNGLYSTIITVNDSIVKILDDNFGVKSIVGLI